MKEMDAFLDKYNLPKLNQEKKKKKKKKRKYEKTNRKMAVKKFFKYHFHY